MWLKCCFYDVEKLELDIREERMKQLSEESTENVNTQLQLYLEGKARKQLRARDGFAKPARHRFNGSNTILNRPRITPRAQTTSLLKHS